MMVCREFPHIETFVTQHSSKYPKLKVRYVYGSPPRLTLKSGNQQETIRIDHWKTEHVQEYLDDRLISAEAAIQ